MSLTMWGAVGVFSMLCALCYAELGACMPESGGEYIYVKHAWGDLIAFLSMWVNLILINPIAVAASSQIFAVYTLKPLYPYCEPPQKVVIIVACLAVGNYFFFYCSNNLKLNSQKKNINPKFEMK